MLVHAYTKFYLRCLLRAVKLKGIGAHYRALMGEEAPQQYIKGGNELGGDCRGESRQAEGLSADNSSCQPSTHAQPRC